MKPEIQTNNYKILQSGRNRQERDVDCYIRNDLSYSIIFVFPREIVSVFFKILLPDSKPIIVGTINHPPNQSNFWEVLIENLNKIDSISKLIGLE